LCSANADASGAGLCQKPVCFVSMAILA
jgi:hypothetical protein